MCWHGKQERELEQCRTNQGVRGKPPRSCLWSSWFLISYLTFFAVFLVITYLSGLDANVAGIIVFIAIWVWQVRDRTKERCHVHLVCCCSTPSVQHFRKIKPKLTGCFSDEHLGEPVHLRLHEQRLPTRLQDPARTQETGSGTDDVMRTWNQSQRSCDRRMSPRVTGTCALLFELVSL